MHNRKLSIIQPWFIGRSGRRGYYEVKGSKAAYRKLARIYPLVMACEGTFRDTGSVEAFKEMKKTSGLRASLLLAAFVVTGTAMAQAQQATPNPADETL
ncbi:MAG TPA: hypothetical protein VMM82_07010, partial [Spirochaetia bacterium]|nr:hypothetical protein [Spirochaetia bacterium]